MLQRFHLVISIVLVLALGAMLLQNRRLAAMQLEAANAAMARAEEALRAERELLERYQPEGELVFAVGDVLEVRDLAGYLDRSIEVVQPDGKLPLPDSGWVDVAGKARTEVEAAVREAYVAYYSEPIDVKLVVREE